MKIKKATHRILIVFLLSCISMTSMGHEILFCGERIPIDDRLVAERLTNIIKLQMRYGIVSQLRTKWNLYLEIIEDILRRSGLPEDFKYLPVVESGFQANLQSSAGAKGIWQLMPQTATGLGLIVNNEVDERTDFRKATLSACRVLADSYLNIKKTCKISSWVLTAAAYNFGIGRIRQTIKQQGKSNYFVMDLNKETAEYVYKIIAIKELFEYPELYMGKFGFNLFSNTPGSVSKGQGWGDINNSGTDKLEVKVNLADGNHPDKLIPRKVTPKKAIVDDPAKAKYIGAYISGNYANFKDGDEITLELAENLEIGGGFTSKGYTITGHGWLVDGKVFIDFGYGNKLILINNTKKDHDGVLLKTLRDRTAVLMKQTLNQE